MDPVLRAALLSWEWRPTILLPLTVAGLLFVLGWRRLRRAGYRRLASGGRLAAYLSGLAVLAVALLSIIDMLQSLLFTMHMVQHLLMMMVAAPLLMLANPLPITLWGLPAPVRRVLPGLLAQRAPFRRALRFVTQPWITVAIFTFNLWGWHAPAMYDAALGNRLIHDIEHIAFFGTALLFWWRVTGAAPRLHSSSGYGQRIIITAIALIQNEILAVALTFTGQPLYTHYQAVPRIWGLSVMDDQGLGGVIMWVPGGMMYVLTIIILLARLMERQEKREAKAAQHALRPL